MENTMKQFINGVLMISILCGGILVAGCSSAPSEEEMRQLNELKAEVASLERRIADMKKEKDNIDRMMAEKNAKLKQCQDDQEAVKKAMGK
jgi:outer membrane murein-binding lipoprotein Lpp